MIPYFCATFGFSSTLSFTILTFSPSEPAISSSAGAIMRHGPHHSAQKSTTTGLADFRTSASNVASETLPTLIGHLVVSRIGKFIPLRSPEPMDGMGERQGRSRSGDGGVQCFVEQNSRQFHEFQRLGPQQRGTHRPA